MTMQQIREADKMLWKKLSEATRGARVMEKADGTRPVQEQLLLLFNDPEVQCQMLPLPKVSVRPGPYDPPRNEKGDPQGKGKGKTKNQPFQLPEGCKQNMPNGKPLLQFV